jgi:hypothetical protein
MPQLDFYSFGSQLLIVIVLLAYIYVLLANFVLPTTSITLKMRAFVFEKNESKYTTLVKIEDKLETYVSNLFIDVLFFVDFVAALSKEETVIKTVSYIFLNEEDLVEDLAEEYSQLNLLSFYLDESTIK